ncbi:hypothetical protein CO656_23700 [Sinorhizobium sp. FG01]|uniref:hypothetical protein n=1 Tax=Sinorhizobium americanum TaxID=194963 RepID=UPI000BEA6A06|nr:hypothetical protein [Sinorhizobium americanum]PDT38082.1 hypothetical protein CO656_23700 [Sinorhizobium sp. FG01]PDT51197.1 hypothetical protein CO664_22825 [Sinorhizobium sp. NG07B]
MLKCLFLAGAVALIASPTLADPYKDESGNGSFRAWDHGDDYRRYSFGIPRGHLPPPGSCRVWFYDRPAGHQPPPTSCRRAQRLADRYGGRVIWGGER